jgi:hypothetical protein
LPTGSTLSDAVSTAISTRTSSPLPSSTERHLAQYAYIGC